MTVDLTTTGDIVDVYHPWDSGLGPCHREKTKDISMTVAVAAAVGKGTCAMSWTGGDEDSLLSQTPPVRPPSSVGSLEAGAASQEAA